jgi:hypothetical protein
MWYLLKLVLSVMFVASVLFGALLVAAATT